MAERDWEQQRPGFTHQILGLRVAFAHVAGRDRVKQAGEVVSRAKGLWAGRCATIAWSRSA